MVDLDVVTTKLAELTDRVGRVRSHCPETAAVLAADRDAFDLVSFNLVLAIQAALDVASHLIGDQGWPSATFLGESFLRLAEHGVLSKTTAAALDSAAGMRNLLVHVYSKVDPVKVHTSARTDLVHLECFASEVAAWLGKSG